MNLIEGKHLGKVTQVDLRTGKETPTEGQVFLLGPKPGVCQQCAVDHRPTEPHNAQSLAYQYWFYNENGRWPDWRDAMAHCSPEIQKHWRSELAKLGVDVDSGQINLRAEVRP